VREAILITTQDRTRADRTMAARPHVRDVHTSMSTAPDDGIERSCARGRGVAAATRRDVCRSQRA
jgi:hypothetical protein